ncbi:UDP-2,4-diacetamido-2,4,6-trideoxy-beta-L-altropyranose hydrolase [Desulforamulus ruminis]|uniref:Pseudaminic acid biosynthesis-associated protein PseG n=1 Tax=Desulforamulus ruminis (strain ATCC 23193 / DSM 2154 / NCIMB 8452 / DL) TaxID=696281 RepID=F6DNQ0_DESRL|nr:UDP-2,4-diacetamido-2,4,6-trideoxy-beta-L-altropyranose hydrolase [Desulforamulus ruminis]AEG59495.1 pseudaminic acid biosynthesis-associated protein PseG [Desulforamulus ruminis DSM 2154]
MKILIRTDSSYQIGSGHVMRCLTLAEALREEGNDVCFISRDLPGNLNDFIKEKGFKVYRLPYAKEQSKDLIKITRHSHWLGVHWKVDAQQTIEILSKEGLDIDWIVIDHYSLDKLYEINLRPFVKKIMIIDDLADRPHECDMLLDQNYYKNMSNRYKGLIPDNCITLLGPKYALLRPEFVRARRKLKNRSGVVNKILVFLGGTDPTNQTMKVLNAISKLNLNHIQVDVIVGQSNPHSQQIRKFCKLAPNFIFHTQVNNMAELMANSDLAIGAGGSTTLERCFLGLPTIALIVADNQAATTNAVAEAGALINLGWSKNITAEKIALEIKNIIAKPTLLRQMSQSSIWLMSSSDLMWNENLMRYMGE